ncbi:MAG TPA: AI-2E family transporter [Actinomycetales bacterium]|nr:AI-2E family transporter [Actinomycetales bacterium]
MSATPAATPAETDGSDGPEKPERIEASEAREPDVYAPHEEPKGWGIAAVTVVSVAAAFVVIMGLKQISTIIMPAFLALNLVIAALPLQRFLQRRGLPRWSAAIIVLLVLYAILAALVGMLVWAIWVAAEEIPRYQDKFNELYAQSIELLARFGVSQDQVGSSLKGIDPQTIMGTVQNVAGQLSSAGGQLAVLVIALTFLAFDLPGIARRKRIIARQRPRLADAMSSFSDGIKSYWIVSTVFGLIVAIMDTVALMILGVPLALVWGVLAFVTNYIPNIGFVLGLVPPALFALLTGGPADAVWVIVIYSVINLVMQSFIQPKFTGDAVGLTPSITFLSLVFWSAVAGPLGAILAVPLTLAAKMLLVDADPRMNWLSTFLTTPDADAKRDRKRAGKMRGATPLAGTAGRVGDS